MNKSLDLPYPQYMLDVLVIGGGLAGLTAAKVLTRAGKRVQVLEAAPHIGGRVYSRTLNGFTLDAGYQVLFPAYPAVKRHLNLSKLNLVSLPSTATIRHGSQTETLGNPFREPNILSNTIFSSMLTWKDKTLLSQLVLKLFQSAPHQLLSGPDESTEHYLQRHGLSQRAINSFFRPFFGGIFLRRDLQTSACLFRYYLRMLIDGGVALPRSGMAEIPKQLAQNLDIRTNIKVTKLAPQTTHVNVFSNHGDLEAKQVIVATDPITTELLTKEKLACSSLGATYLHYALAQNMPHQPHLQLNAEEGLINNAHWLSHTLPERAPSGQHLLTVTVLGTPELDDIALDARVRGELSNWYSKQITEQLTTLLIERIPHAQFTQPAQYARQLPGHATHMPSVFIASEITSMSGIQGAMESGEKAAAIVLNDLARMSFPRGS